MNIQDIVEFVNQLIEQHRVDVGEQPKVTPVTWKGINMTIEEAKLAILQLEVERVHHQKAMNNTQLGGEITKLAAVGAGLAAMVTGVALMLFPSTALAGIVTLISGIGAVGVGNVVGDGVKDIGAKRNVQDIQQIDMYIDSIKNAIIASI